MELSVSTRVITCRHLWYDNRCGVVTGLDYSEVWEAGTFVRMTWTPPPLLSAISTVMRSSPCIGRVRALALNTEPFGTLCWHFFELRTSSTIRCKAARSLSNMSIIKGFRICNVFLRGFLDLNNTINLYPRQIRTLSNKS